jgi:hypothetical protein
MWPVITTVVFDEWALALSPAVAEAVGEGIVRLRALGPELKRPHADTLKGSKHANMKELRVKAAGQVIRIAFAFDPTRTGVLLVGGSKQGVKEKRFYAELIRRADALYDEYLTGRPV